MKRGLLSFVLLLPLLAGATPADTTAVVSSINALGLDLYRVQPGDGNLLLSPYSIQDALAMTYAGAAGDTRAEMQRVLHYPADDIAIHGGFAELARELMQIAQDSAKRAEETKNAGGDPNKPIEFHLANRLFVQRGYELCAPFLALVKDHYGALPGELDFAHAAEDARMTINHWAEDNTKGKIHDLIPSGGPSDNTRLILANAVYLYASWEQPFKADATKPEPFFVRGTERVLVPTMCQRTGFRYEHHHGFTILALLYEGGDLQCLIFLPDRRKGLPTLEQKITPALLAECTKLPSSDVILYLPKFQLEPLSMRLGDQLRQLGLQTAFDQPKGSANFDRMAPRKPDEYLAIDDVAQKAFFKLDEEGTEAAAASDIVVLAALGVESSRPEPIEVRVDHPFIFAIQHVPSGECLFLGRVTDPR